MKPVHFLPLLAVLSFSCSDSKRDIAHAPEMKAKIEAFLEENREISRSLPKSTIAPQWDLDPAPTFGSGEEDQPVNTIVGSSNSIYNFDSGSLSAGSDFRLLFYGPSRLLKERHADQPAPEGYEQELTQLIERPYVLVYQVIAHEKPSIINDETYTGGATTVRYALYDRNRKAWHCAFEALASPDGRVQFESSRKEYVKRDANFHILEPVREEFKSQMETKLAEATGGVFKL